MEGKSRDDHYILFWLLQSCIKPSAWRFHLKSLCAYFGNLTLRLNKVQLSINQMYNLRLANKHHIALL